LLYAVANHRSFHRCEHLGELGRGREVQHPVDSVDVDLINVGLTVGTAGAEITRASWATDALGAFAYGGVRWLTLPFIEEPNVRRDAVHEAVSERSAWCVRVVKDERLGGRAFRDARLGELWWKMGAIPGKPRVNGVAARHGDGPLGCDHLGAFTVDCHVPWVIARGFWVGNPGSTRRMELLCHSFLISPGESSRCWRGV
jgi:hypothetical protein